MSGLIMAIFGVAVTGNVLRVTVSTGLPLAGNSVAAVTFTSKAAGIDQLPDEFEAAHRVRPFFVFKSSGPPS